MVTTRKRAPAAEIPTIPRRRSKGDRPRSPSPPQNLSDSREGNEGYEKLREERIRENLERMQNLGIVDLSIKLKRSLLSPRRSTVPRSPSDPSKPALPPRRSPRLQNITPVTYAEDHVKKSEDTVRKRSASIEEGQKEEFYTDEHDKLLGTCEMSWTLFVDGYGSDGNRIYDQITGKTCHQCRQKTLGYRTHCIKCNLVQGQFCGDCLFMRYGEHVLEAKKNPNWTCPVCRGICNCSLCRVKKGWAPTGALYKKVLKLGFKSVAHYLIQTRRCPTNSGELDSAQLSSKKSLHFIDAEGSPLPNNANNPGPEKRDKKNSECNGECESRSAGEHTVSNAVVVENTAELGSNSARGKEPSDTAKTTPDCIASRLRKQGLKISLRLSFCGIDHGMLIQMFHIDIQLI